MKYIKLLELGVPIEKWYEWLLLKFHVSSILLMIDFQEFFDKHGKKLAKKPMLYEE